MEYYKVILEGIDKTGKDLIKEYIRKLSNGKYTSSARGFVSLIAYSNLYERNYEYDISQEENTLIAYLTVEKEDWEIRCKINHEPPINYEKNKEAFDKVIEDLSEKNFMILQYNTSKITPYLIAKNIVDMLDKLNSEN